MGNVFKYQDLFWQLTAKEIKARYKQSILGYGWAILVPLINLLVLSVIFSYIFKVPTGNIPYPIFLFVALVPWTFFNNSITFATSSVLSNSSLVTKVSLPREILPISAVCARIVDLLLTSIVLFIFLLQYGISLKLTFFYLPVVFLVQLLLILGISFILSATNVFFRDIENILGVVMTVWMYLTPIIYSPTLIPDNLKTIFYLNPMTGIINSYRDILLYGVFSDLTGFLYSTLFSVSAFILGYLYFKNRSRYFADVV